MVRLISGTCGLFPIPGEVPAGGRRRASDVAFMPERVVLVLLAEMSQRGVDDPAGRVAEPAQAPAVLQPVRNALQGVELGLRSLIGQDSVVRPDRPVAADPAGCAFAEIGRASCRER